MLAQIIIEGILERGTMEDGKPCKQDEYLAGEMFGQESLINENNVSSVYVLCTQPTKLLEIKREYFMRYIRPAQRAEWDRSGSLKHDIHKGTNTPGARAKVLFALASAARRI